MPDVFEGGGRVVNLKPAIARRVLGRQATVCSHSVRRPAASTFAFVIVVITVSCEAVADSERAQGSAPSAKLVQVASIVSSLSLCLSHVDQHSHQRERQRRLCLPRSHLDSLHHLLPTTMQAGL